MNAPTYPNETLCAAENCGHRFDHHRNIPDGPTVCTLCRNNDEHGFANVQPHHTFVPRRLAGGALTPTAERAAYEIAMRGGDPEC